jgi:hypothetical protein
MHLQEGMKPCGISVLGVFLFACGSTAAPPAEAPPGLQSASATQPDTSVEKLDPPPAPAADEDSAYDSNPCEGSDLDLGSLAAQSVCNLDRTAEPLPAELEARLASDSFSITEGSPSEVRVILTNTSASPLAVEFDASCRFLNMVELAIYRRNARLDRVSSQCDVDAKVDCSGHVIGVTIDAGGEAFIRLGVPARVALLGDECVEYPSRILSPGVPYTVKVRTAFSEEPLLAAMQVKKLVLLKRAECASYGKKVAEVAEPTPALRKGVSDTLTAQCRRKQPTQEFADCQRAAKTTDALVACGTGER